MRTAQPKIMEKRIFWQKPEKSNVESRFGWHCARWLLIHNKTKFEESDVHDFTVWVLKKNLLTSAPDSLKELVEYVREQCVNIQVRECCGPSPFLLN